MPVALTRARAVVVLATLMVLGLWSAHQEMTPVLADATEVDIVGHLGGHSLAIDLQGDYAYVGEGVQLTILDVSNPGAPVVAGKSPVFLDVVTDVTVDGNYAYVTIGYEGLAIIDVSTPSAPTVVGTLDGPGDLYALEVAVAGQYAYVAAGSYGLWIVDVANPAAPAEVSVTFDTIRDALSLEVAGNLAYVASGYGLSIVDVTNPEAPVVAGVYGNLDGDEQADVAIQGNYAYVVNDSRELVVVDITSSTDPVDVGSVSLPYWSSSSGITVAGNRAYVVDSIGNLIALDISDPENPTEIGYLEHRQGDSFGPVNVAVAGNYVYFNDYFGLRIADISNPGSPTPASTYDTIGPSPSELTAAGDYVYVADARAGLIILDVADPTHPRRVGSYDTPGYAREVVVSGDYAYVTDASAGLQIIDVTNPGAPAAVGSLGGLGDAHGLDVAGDYAYVTAYSSGNSLRVIDVSDPTNPAQVGSLPTPGFSWSVDVVGEYAYVGDANNLGGFVIIDVSEPASPVQDGSYDGDFRVFSMQVIGDLAYLAASYNGGLRVVNVANSTAPVDVGSLDTPGDATNLTVSGAYAYVADGPGGLRIIDATDPALPVEVGYNALKTYAYARDVAVAGRYAYVLADYGGLYVLEYPVDDDDGQSDETEDGAPNNGDGNNDGIPDSEQSNVVSLPNSEDGSYLTLEAPAGIALVDVQATPNPSPGDTPAGASFPVGFLDFAIEGISPGEAVAVTIILHGGETVDAYYKYGPEPGNPADHWYEFDYDGTTGAEFLSDRIVLHLVDGQRGDADLAADGVIVDPGAPAVASEAAGTIYVSPVAAGTAGGVRFDPRDILVFDIGTQTWAMHFDGSDAGIKPLSAFAILDDNRLVMAFKAKTKLPGLGTVMPHDLVAFVPSTLGEKTKGAFAWYLDGSDVGLTQSSERIDAVDVLPDGRILISPSGAAQVGPNNSVTAAGQDLLAFTPTRLGQNSAGNWTLYFDGSTVSGLSSENVVGATVDATSDEIYLVIGDEFTVGGVRGGPRDVLRLEPDSGGFAVHHFWNGLANGFKPKLGGIELGD